MAPPKSNLTLIFMAAFTAFSLSSACIFKYGTSPDSLAPPHGGDDWDHGMKGDDWIGADASGKQWACPTGIRQSPINVPSIQSLDSRGSTIARNLRTRWSYPTISSNGSNVEVINNGHTIQVEWLTQYNADVEIIVPAHTTNSTPVTAVLSMDEHDAHSTVKATPLQFHFHSTSEHLLEGKYYPLELHIVHRIMDLPACAAKGGCYTVLGVMFELTDGSDNPFLDAIWAAMPLREGTINYLPPNAEISLEDLLPKRSDRDYVTYEGSLTTPPCSEGLLWHVMTRPQKISHAQWAQYQKAVGLKDCDLKNAAATAADTHSAHHHRRISRRLMATAATEPNEDATHANPDDYTCKVIAYGYNYRNAQKLYGRTVKFARV